MKDITFITLNNKKDMRNNMYTRESAKRLFGKGHYKLIDKLYDRLGPEQIIGIKSKYGRIDLYINGSDEDKEFGFEIEKESEKLNAQSEVARAKGMAEAIEIENGQLTETYIKYLWVRTFGGVNNSTIYIPTEAGLPLLEARN